LQGCTFRFTGPRGILIVMAAQAAIHVNFRELPAEISATQRLARITYPVAVF
jgi:hypothetical protein